MKKSTYFGIVIAVAIVLGAVAFAQPNPTKVGKTGHITLAQETMVGNAALPAGEYEVRQRTSSSGHYIEFTRVVVDYTVGDTGLSPYEYDVVAKVPCKVEVLNSTADKTAAEIATSPNGDRLASLEIRGENVLHVFPAGPAASAMQSQTAGM